MFKRKQDVPKVDDFDPFLGPIYPQKTQNIAKNQNFFQNLHPYDYKITQVPGPRSGDLGDFLDVTHRNVVKFV